MNRYEDTMSVKDALQVYFSAYHFAGGGYDKKWFKIKVGPLFIPLPNIKARVEAVRIHDIHHLVTGYRADWKGEVEIGAWEIATGCDKYMMAWLLNLGSFFVGLLLYPRSLLSAFMRGKRAGTNLYHNADYDTLLNSTVGELRKTIQQDKSVRNGFDDYLSFAGWCLVALVYHVSIILLAGWGICKVFTGYC